MKIDIIIPCYKAHSTLARCLCSIGTQTIKNDIQVILVNDADGTDYTQYKDMFKNILHIKVCNMKTNGGPGEARQFGMNHSKNPLIMFMDADDTLASPYVVDTLRESLLKEDTNAMITSVFMEENDNTLLPHNNDLVWVFGKMYKRSFISKYGIHFPKGLRANEDMCFNKQCLFFSNKEERIKSIGNTSYYWMYQPKSITRINNYEYYYNDSFTGMLTAWTYAIDYTLKNGGNKETIHNFIKDSIGKVYAYYIQITERKPQFQERAWSAIVAYYKNIFIVVRGSITLKEFQNSYESAMKNAYMDNKLFECMPELSFRHFIRKLDEEL